MVMVLNSYDVLTTATNQITKFNMWAYAYLKQDCNVFEILLNFVDHFKYFYKCRWKQWS